MSIHRNAYIALNKKNIGILKTLIPSQRCFTYS